MKYRVGSRGRVQGVRTPPPWYSAQKKKTMWFIGVDLNKRRVYPLLKKILDPPLK